MSGSATSTMLRRGSLSLRTSVGAPAPAAPNAVRLDFDALRSAGLEVNRRRPLRAGVISRRVTHNVGFWLLSRGIGDGVAPLRRADAVNMEARTITLAVTSRTDDIVPLGTFVALTLRDERPSLALDALGGDVVLCFRNAEFAPAAGDRIQMVLTILPATDADADDGAGDDGSASWSLTAD